MAAIEEQATQAFASAPPLVGGSAIARGIDADRALELVSVFVFSASLIGLAATLAGEFHAPQVLIGSLLLSGCYFWRTRNHQLLPGLKPRWWHLLLLLALGLFFRVPAYHYVLGDQDEGIYVNIAHHIDQKGTDALQDNVKSQLSDSPYLQTYLDDNYIAGGYLPGIYSQDHGKIVFQFYHLFPIWMALFAGIFGATCAVYALTLFAILSIFYFYRIALLLTKSHVAALIAGSLLALNPLHAFFSKFPVTEVPTVAFSLMGFTLLAGFWSHERYERPRLILGLSVVAFFCLFTTRISGFMYMPFFLLLGLAESVWDQNSPRRKAVQLWIAATACAYVLSIFYGYQVSPYYAGDIYRTSFDPLLGKNWKAALALIILLSLTAWWGLALVTRSPNRRAWIAKKAAFLVRFVPGTIVLLATIASAIKTYRLGWTDRYLHDPWLGDYWNLAGSGWTAALASSLWALAVYMGPLLIGFYALVVIRRTDPRLEFLRWFVAGFYTYAAVLLWTLPYGPYFGRYLLSEFLPYAILFIVCSWGGLRVGVPRSGLTALMALGLLYAGIASAAQIGKSEDAGAYEALSKLVAPVDKNDLILLEAPAINPWQAPIAFTLGRRVITISEKNLRDAGYLAELNSIYDDLFLISLKGATPRGFTPVDSVRLTIMSYVHSFGFPRHVEKSHDAEFYLYKLEYLPVPVNTTQTFGKGSQISMWLGNGWSAPEAWGVWSDGEHAELVLNRKQFPDNSPVNLRFDVNVYVTPKHPSQRIEIRVDGNLVRDYRVQYPTTRVALDVPINDKDLSDSSPVNIDFHLPDAVSPQSLNSSADVRRLGIGLASVTLQGPLAQPR